MDHVAIMKKEWGLLPKILSGEKKIESRWYRTRRSPWNEIRSGDTVYFKDSGAPITVKAQVTNVRQFEGLTASKVAGLIDQYGGVDGIGLDNRDNFKKLLCDKKYCLLIFFDHVESVTPFEIDKKGYGLQAAWLVTENIESLKKTSYRSRSLGGTRD